MADDGRGNIRDDDDIERREDRPLVLRSYGKCPREYKYGEDFRSYLARFNIYAELNNIPMAQRIALLFTLLDNRAFDAVTNMQLENVHNFQEVTERLIQKFDSPSGAIGNQLRLS